MATNQPGDAQFNVRVPEYLKKKFDKAAVAAGVTYDLAGTIAVAWFLGLEHVERNIEPKDTMKIDDMTMSEIRDRMGADATDAEAQAMMMLLIDSGEIDTDDISDERWFKMVGDAVTAVANCKS